LADVEYTDYSDQVIHSHLCTMACTYKVIFKCRYYTYSNRFICQCFIL